MRWQTIGILAVLAAAGMLALSTGVKGGQEVFPHEEHAGLFPLCVGCHEGVPEGNFAEFYPEPESCDGCHDGVELDEVEWEPPAYDEPEPIEFTHPAHSAAVLAAGDAELDCAACHVEAGREPMSLDRELVTGTCFSCHGHEAENHFVDANCETCHVESGVAGVTTQGPDRYLDGFTQHTRAQVERLTARRGWSKRAAGIGTLQSAFRAAAMRWSASRRCAAIGNSLSA